VPTAIGTYATVTLLKQRLLAAGVTDTADDTLLGTICDQVNQFIESPHGTGRVLAPISSATYLLDGTGTPRLYFPKGIRTATALTFADTTGGTKVSAGTAGTDYFLRPAEHDRTPGWPAMWLDLSNRASRRYFPLGYDTVSLTCTAGWAAIPDDIVDVALTTATRAWAARQAGQADIVGNDETGAPIVSRFVSGFHWAAIKAYRVVVPPG
jgi:hypothetical protein